MVEDESMIPDGYEAPWPCDKRMETFDPERGDGVDCSDARILSPWIKLLYVRRRIEKMGVTWTVIYIQTFVLDDIRRILEGPPLRYA